MEAIERIGIEYDLTDEYYDISKNERIGEYVMLRLRLREGVDTVKFSKLFDLDFEELYGKYLKIYTENGFMEHTGSRYAFTPKGMYVSNYILSAMLDFNSDIISNIINGTDK